ncbi:MAG: hypothetical protein ACFFE8_03410 [Candidatus Heimdallarchaeota archaeon]
MERPPLYVLIIGSATAIIILIAILHGLMIFDEATLESFSWIILLVLMGSTPIIFYQFMLNSKIQQTDAIQSETHQKVMEIGIAFGVLMNDRMKLLAKSERCNFPDHYIKSLLEYSAVFYLQGKTDQLYGPFPIDSQNMNRSVSQSTSSFPAFDYFSYGFKFSKQTTFKNTDPLAIFLIHYPKHFESRIIGRKEVFSSYLEKLRDRLVDFNEIISDIDIIQNEVHLLSLL